jgi:two-component system response regulator HydG
MTDMHAGGLHELISFLEAHPEPHILCDRQYRIIAANTAYRTKWAARPDVVGRKCYEVSHHYTVPCDEAGEACPLSRSVMSGQRERVLHLHHTATGEVYENIELSPLRDASGEVTYFIEKLDELPVARGLAHAQGLVGRSPAFRRMLEMVARVAPSEATVLLQGESGTGKELVAGAIHHASRRSRGPFVAVDCSGLPETLFESELFGHEKGAFTGAAVRKTGLVESASGGTLFLDEVGDIPLTMQVKLLRLLETGTYRRVGGTELRKADFRLLSATHQPLRKLVAAGGFRQDLYFRLNAFPICLPALRERREDIPLLAEALLARVAPKRELRISAEAMRALTDFDYPGNVRELRNILERASLLCDGSELQSEHLPDEVRHGETAMAACPSAPGAPAPASWEDMQMQVLRQAITGHQGTRKALARSLGMSERTLYRKLAEVKDGDSGGL